MLDRRRCLTVILACVGAILLLLALGCASQPAAKRSLATAGSLTADAPLTVGGTGAVGRDIGPDIGLCDPRCAHRGVSTVVPEGRLLACHQRASAQYLRGEILAGRITTALPPWLAASYVGNPPIRFHQCPIWTTGHVQGVEITGCMAGVAWGPSISVSLGEQARVLAVVAWESANANLTWGLTRYDLGDGSEVAAASNYAVAACVNAVLPLAIR